MTTRKFIGFFALVLAVVVLLPAQADADLIGVHLGWQYYGGGGPVTGERRDRDKWLFVDNGGVGGTYIAPVSGPVTVFNIDATATTITFDYSVAQVAGPWSGSPRFALTDHRQRYCNQPFVCRYVPLRSY